MSVGFAAARNEKWKILAVEDVGEVPILHDEFSVGDETKNARAIGMSLHCFVAARASSDSLI